MIDIGILFCNAFIHKYLSIIQILHREIAMLFKKKNIFHHAPERSAFLAHHNTLLLLCNMLYLDTVLYFDQRKSFKSYTIIDKIEFNS